MRCKSCRKQCEPFNSLNAFCDADCAISYLNGNTGKKLIEKVKRKKFREKKKEVKGLSHWSRVTQTVVNKYVRLRDRNLPCISCGKWDHELKEAVRKGKWDAGHYKTVGSHPEIRFDTKNINKQCLNCNGFNAGNIPGQERGIEARYGQERLDWLNGPHKLKHYSIDDLERIRKIFSKKTRRLEKAADIEEENAQQ